MNGAADARSRDPTASAAEWTCAVKFDIVPCMQRSARPISWIKAARKAFDRFPDGARERILQALEIAAEGRTAAIAKPMIGLPAGVYEGLAVPGRCLPGDLHGAVSRSAVGGACISEKIKAGHQDASR
jgi:hypothetical protein